MLKISGGRLTSSRPENAVCALCAESPQTTNSNFAKAKKWSESLELLNLTDNSHVAKKGFYSDGSKDEQRLHENVNLYFMAGVLLRTQRNECDVVRMSS